MQVRRESGGEQEVPVVPVGTADLAQNAQHLLGRGRTRLVLAGDGPDPADGLLPPHSAELDTRVPTGELGEDRHPESGGDEALDHLVVLAAEADPRLEPRIATELEHLIA